MRKAVLESEPEAIVHEATALAEVKFSRNLDRSFVETNRLRTEGTDNLIAAAREAGVPRFVAQSGASYGRYAREGGPVKTEDDPLDPTPVDGMRETAAAISYLDQAVTEAGGIALRYGAFYGAANDGLLEPVRKRPVWLARLIAGEAAVMMGTEARGASNAKAKRELGWTLRYPSWRQGFAAAYRRPDVSSAIQIPTPARG